MRSGFGFIIFFILLFEFSAVAKPWKFEGSDISPELLERLRNRYSDIKDPLELQAFLKEVERVSFNKKLEAIDRGDHIAIVFDSTKPITNVEFDLVTRAFRSSYENIAQRYLGLAYSEELMVSLRNQVTQMLQSRGFFHPKIELSSRDVSSGFEVDVKIDEGIPCLINSIETEFSLPEGVTLGVEEGAICDKPEFSRALRQLEEGLTDDGYKQIRIEAPEFYYDEESNSSKVVVKGNLGRIITYEVRESDSRIFFLEDIFSDSSLSTIDPNIMTPDAVQSELVRQYKNRGYVDVKVGHPKIIQTGDNRFRYIFEVNPGQQYRISNVILEGNRFFSDEDGLEFLGMSSFWQGNKPLNIEEIRRGIDNLGARYGAEGFWEVKIREPRVTRTRETGQAQVVILINEGKRRFLREVSFSGLNAEEQGQIRSMLDLNEGDSVDRSKLIDFERGIKTYFVTKGYLYVDVQLKFTQIVVANRVALSLKVTVERGTRVRIGTVTVKGLIRTKEKVVLRELRFETGDWYNPEAIDESRRALLSLGLFQTVQIQQSDINAINDKTAILDLTIGLKEGKPGNVRFGPGWSLLRGGRFSVESSYNNLGGVGRQVFLRGGLSEEAQQSAIGPRTLVGRNASIGLLEPYIFELPLTGTVSLSHQAYANDIWVFSNRGEVAVSHKFRRFIPGSIVSLYYGQRINDTEGTLAQQQATVATPQTRVGFIGVRYNWDNRDNISWPTKGFYLQTDISWARFPLGGELEYFYWSADLSQYKKLSDNFVLAFGLALSAYNDIRNKNPKNNDILPSAQLLQLDGTKVVRGFREKSLGPTVSYFPVVDEDTGETIQQKDDVPGGTHRSLFRTELRYQIIDKTFAVTTFVDAGTVFFTEQELDRFRTDTSFIKDNDSYDFSDLLSRPDYIWKKHFVSYGLSLNYLTPVGSVNLAYGLPWKRCAVADGSCEIEKGKFEDHWLMNGEFHINVGATF